LLGRLTLDQVARIDDGGSEATPPLNPHVLTSLLANVSRRRRNSRIVTWTVAAAAAAVLVISVLIGVQPHSAMPRRAEAPAMPIDKIATVQIVSADTGNVLLQRSL